MKDGGPAFPNITDDMPVAGHPGMTLRDHFAAAALFCLVDDDVCDPVLDAEKLAASWAKASYLVADAMLKAREENSDD